jgi:hypothetical protein
MAFLHDYEYSRESGWMQQQVEFIRYGHIPPPTYWSPNPDFGWPEWPLHSYLSVPADERQKRLQILAATNYDELQALLVRPPITGPSRAGNEIRIFLPEELTVEEQREAVLARLRIETSGREAVQLPRRAQGRAATVARRFDQVRALSAARLLQLHSATEALEMMNEAHGKLIFSDSSTLRRSANRVHRFLVAFILRAKHQITRGLWPPPFGPYHVRL